MLVSPAKIHPSQDYLKEGTVRFILECIRTGNLKDLPPTPLVRADETGELIAIDGHNLIAVRQFLGQSVEVVLATTAGDGLPATSQANIERNKELALKYDSALSEQRRVAAAGITSFADLIANYPNLFIQPPTTA
ncbi:MAG TPA: hypothetical protein VLF69_00100 [Candidatus Saccharimonadales bacterium]|nr:hypothetical protein [Candidatus Saccharimonadales bacterium]